MIVLVLSKRKNLTYTLDEEICDILNRVISTEEVKKVVANLKNSKAAGLDNSRVTQALDENSLDLVALILSNIFDRGSFPEEWALARALGMIVILFKEGSKWDLNSYTTLTCLAKFWAYLSGHT